MSWQKKLAQGFTSVSDLLGFLELPFEHGDLFAERQFSTRVPLSFAKRMQKGNPRDPLLLQVLASPAEIEHVDGYVSDPLSELKVNPMKGIIHKYRGRVLLTLVGACAVNCRYCFRRHFPYQENNPGREGWSDVYQYIANDPTISEVILSGGDPLLASDIVLKELFQQLEAIPHVTTVRFHTRIPVVFPERVDNDFLELMANCRLNKVIVLHCNHAQELAEDVNTACQALKKSGCHLLNQTVFLAGINDDVEVLASLSNKLFSYGVLPYYLHVLDKVAGAAHFDLTLETVKSIYSELQSMLPGYLLPRLVREEAGKSSKTLL